MATMRFLHEMGGRSMYVDWEYYKIFLSPDTVKNYRIKALAAFELPESTICVK